jgi:outer membrane protein insertion porin family
LVGSAGIVIPPIFGENIRTTVFVDGGNVYNNKIDFNDLRYSVGVAVMWASPMGPLEISFAKPITRHRGDHYDTPQFTIGASF